MKRKHILLKKVFDFQKKKVLYKKYKIVESIIKVHSGAP